MSNIQLTEYQTRRFAAKVRALLAYKEWSFNQLIEQLPYAASTIKYKLNGGRILDNQFLTDLASVLEVSEQWLIDETQEIKYPKNQ